MLDLRYYQRAAIDAQYAHWAGSGGNSLIVLATGTGKSLIAATLVKELLAQFPSMRIVVLAHVHELIEQNCKEMLRLWPQAPIGIYSAGLGRRDARAQILFAGIQSIYDKGDILGGFDLVIVDECHLLPRKTDTMYGHFLSANSAKMDMRLVGLTATPYRLDSGRLDRGEGAIFEKIVYSYDIAQGIKEGFLSPLISKCSLSEIDTSSVHVRGGEFVPAELERAALDNGKIGQACDEMIALGQGRKSWLAFCCGVKHAHAVEEALMARGVKAATVTGKTPAGERRRLAEEFRAGRIRCLANVNVLTTGFNVSGVDMIALMRPTLSAGLYIQMVGRGTRLASGKSDCLVLDFAGLIRKHGPVDDIIEKDAPGKRDAKEPRFVNMKECPGCGGEIPAIARLCQLCGMSLVTPWGEPEHDGLADGSVEILRGTLEPQWRTVTGWSFHIHKKAGSLPTLRIDYECGLLQVSEWLCLDHEPGTFPHRMAAQAWRQIAYKTIPMTVDAAFWCQKMARRPHKILIKKDGKFWKVIKREMSGLEVEAG